MTPYITERNSIGIWQNKQLCQIIFQNFHQFKAFVGLSDCRIIATSPFYTRCLIQDVLSVIKGWRDVARDLLCRTTLSWRNITGMQGTTHQCKQRKQNDCLKFINSYCISRIHGHILISKDIVSIFPLTVRSTFPKKKMRCRKAVKWSNSIELDIGEWTSINNVTSCTKCSPF